MKDSDEQDDLWQLLGKAKKPAVSQFFARNVLREIRLSRQEKTVTFPWVRNRWRLVSLCSLATVLLAVNASRLFVPHKELLQVVAEVPQVSQIASKPDDTEVITHLDELVAYEENSIWLEDSSK